MKIIAVLVGSLRKESYNRMLFEAFKKNLPEGFHFEEVSIDFPLYNADIEEQGMPEVVQKAKKVVETSDGVLIITPEYNRGVPGALKNAIDWLSRPDGGSSWKGKKVASVGATTGTLGTASAQQQLRAMLVYLDTHIMGQPEFYLGRVKEKLQFGGVVTDEQTGARIRKYVQAFADFISA